MEQESQTLRRDRPPIGFSEYITQERSSRFTNRAQRPPSSTTQGQQFRIGFRLWTYPESRDHCVDGLVFTYSLAVSTLSANSSCGSEVVPQGGFKSSIFKRSGDQSDAAIDRD